MFGKPSARKAIAAGTVLLTLAAACSCGYAAWRVPDTESGLIHREHATAFPRATVEVAP
jgi:hypothetical protein